MHWFYLPSHAFPRRYLFVLVFFLLLVVFCTLRYYQYHCGIANVDRWRITNGNPARDTQELDCERCAALHNHILELGWVRSVPSLAQLDRRSWWEFHGAAAEKDRHQLAPSVVEFLRRTQIVTSDPQWHWHYYFWWLELYGAIV